MSVNYILLKILAFILYFNLLINNIDYNKSHEIMPNARQITTRFQYL